MLARRGLERTRLFGFDSFEGMPAVSATDDLGTWKPGDFRMDIDVTRKFLRLQGMSERDVTLTKGWFSDTLTDDFARRHGLDHVGIAMIDCDIYTSTTEALAFCARRFRDAALLIFDDWNAGDLAAQGLGEKRAFDELLARHPEYEARPLGSYNETSEMFLLTCRR